MKVAESEDKIEQTCYQVFNYWKVKNVAWVYTAIQKAKHQSIFFRPTRYGIGLNRQTVAAIEAGKHSPSLEAAFRIALVLGVPLGEVFQWEAIGG